MFGEWHVIAGEDFEYLLGQGHGSISHVNGSWLVEIGEGDLLSNGEIVEVDVIEDDGLMMSCSEFSQVVDVAAE